MRVSKGARIRNDVRYQWIRRPDGSVFRQLSPMCIRALHQLLKGKGLNRVHVRQ